MFKYTISLIFLIFYMIWALILYPFYYFSGKKIGKFLVRYLLIVVLKLCGVKIVTEGLENVDENEKYLVVSNHQSVFDIPVIGAALPLNMRIIAKKELSRFPFFGQMLLLYDFVFVDRKNPRKAVRDLKKAADLLKHYSFLVFPEGTRSIDGSVGSFKTGGISLAFESGVKILPVAITGVDKVMKRGQLIVHAGTVTMKVFPPVTIMPGESRKNVTNKLQSMISEYVSQQRRVL
ncbi:MAG TPA: lysophospholipid acyltransferase family protein [bacterium]|nr:lysophospholipid acyltransferase family protein [bacterium]HPS29991.1 lysophospholipid acyltransferase family protein [bacterium]